MEQTQLHMQEEKPAAHNGEKKGISGSTIKIIAVAVMLIDHIAAVILARALLADGPVDETGAGIAVYQIMRSIGRLGFPIFCFLLVEGAQRTRDVRKYALRLAVFAFISEIPFDLATSGHFFEWRYQNVYFTLFLGLFALCAFAYFERAVLPRAAGILFTVTGAFSPAIYFGMLTRYSFAGAMEARIKAILAVFLITLAVLAVCGRKRGIVRVRIVCEDITVLMFVMYLADFLMTDYAGLGVLTIAAMYAFRKNRVWSMAAGCAVLTAMSLGELPAFLAVLLIAGYNGKRGLRLKYLFYAFYPVHLLILYLIVLWMGLGEVALL